MSLTTTLPIETVLPQLKNTLMAHTSAVLMAPPGAGKTTRVPLALLDEPWLKNRRILMLEPRRLATRAAARYMAKSLGETVGETVGYRVRLDSQVGPRTRIEVITEGVLTRLLQADPELEGVGLVIFDEFHERSLQADLGLALCLESQAVLREDLRILVMSATLDAEPIARLLGGAPILMSEGRSFPVETRYLNRQVDGPIEPIAVRKVLEALQTDDGDILVFLPGAGEIHRVLQQLREAGLAAHIAPLHGSLPQEEQDRAIQPCPPGQRKVVLATAIAETSLTVEGIVVVIDSGVMRVPRFSPRTGMGRLETVPVSRASADQRRGRAGRLGPGVCHRLWTEQQDRGLVPHGVPEILESDLAPLALDLAAWGTANAADLRWLDPPPEGALAQARTLLRQLGALGQDGTITPHGRRMAQAGLHPRLARMILKATPMGLGGLACELAALLSERDILRSDRGTPDADMRLRVEALYNSPDEGPVRRIRTEAAHWKRAFGIPAGSSGDRESCGLLLAFAYPDRIAQRRGAGRFLLRNGRGAAFSRPQPLFDVAYLVAVDLDDQGAESRIHLAAEVDTSDLERHFGDQMETECVILWDRSAQAVRARRRVRLGAFSLKDHPLSDTDPEATLEALLDGIAVEGLEILPWTRAARQLQHRLIFAHQLEAGWPEASDGALLAALGDWLGPHLLGMKSRDDLQRLQLTEVLETLLPWDKRREFDTFAPTHLVVPSGSRIPIDYSDPSSPVVAVRLQEVFGLLETPCIARGNVSLTLHLLSPAHRPVQVTRDLASFWRTAYFDVKKELKGRYPKHSWPDDPLSALPTNRTRNRM